MRLDVIAIGISLLSAVVAAFSLGWNIYRDVILKPRLQVRISVSYLISPGTPKETKLIVSATNFGPGQIHCSTVALKSTSIWRRILRKEKFAITFYDYTDPMSGRLPAKLDVGENVSLFFPYEKDPKKCFLANQYTHVGINDSFGRTHWCSRRDYRRAVHQYDKEFQTKG